MVPGYWQFASVFVLVLCISSSVVLTDTPNCDSNDEHCLVIPPKADALTQRKNSDKEQQQLTRDVNRQERKAERDIDRHWDHRQSTFLSHPNRESRRLYDRIRDVKKSALDHRNSENTRELRRLRGNRRYLAGERLSDLHSVEVDDSEDEGERFDTLRDRLLHRLALSASENGYLTARSQRRFARFHDDIESARMTTRFERLQKHRMAHLNRDDDENDGVRVLSRFERTRNDKMTRLSKNDANSRATSENNRRLPHHFQNLKRIRESIGRRESGFERRNAYATLIRNQVRLSDDTVDSEKDRIEPRFETQRKHRQELEDQLRKESIEGVKTTEQEAFIENRRMRKEQRKEMEERMIREEKQRLLEEEQRIRGETERVRESEQRMRETERRIQKILQQIRENERRAHEEKQRKMEEEKRLRQSVSVRERGDENVNDNDQKIRYNENVDRFKEFEDKLDRQDERQDYYDEREIFDDSHEREWDYSDYSDSLESYEDDWELERRLREDIRLFPDIERQIRENVQMYGREFLDAGEASSDKINSDNRKGVEERELSDERQDTKNRRKRSLDNKTRTSTVDRRFRRSSELETNKENRQIAENRSFRSQNERLIRRVNLRRMDEMRQSDTRNERFDTTSQRHRGINRLESRNENRLTERKIRDYRDRRVETESKYRRTDLSLKRDRRQIENFSEMRNKLFERTNSFVHRRERRTKLEKNENTERNDRIDRSLQRRENRQRRNILERNVNIERRNERISETVERLVNNRRREQSLSRINSDVQRRDNRERADNSHDRDSNLTGRERITENRNNRIETTLQRREDNRRTEDLYERRTTQILRKQENQQRTEDSRNRRTDLENTDRNTGRRNEATLARPENNRRIENLYTNRFDMLRLKDRKTDESSRYAENNQRVEESRNNSPSRRFEQESVIRDTSTSRDFLNQQLNDRVELKSSLKEHLEEFNQKHLIFTSPITIHLLQTALIAVIILKVLKQQEFSEKKFGSNSVLNKLAFVFNNLKVF